MQLRTFFLPVSVLATTAVLSPAIAQDYYVEGAVGAIDETSYFLTNETLDTNLVGGRIGWDVTPYFAVEGEYFAGLNEHNESVAVRVANGVPLTAVTEQSIASTYGIYGKVSLPIGDSLKLFTRIGYTNIERDGSTRLDDEDSAPRDLSYDDYNTAIGIGSSYDLTDRIYARLDATTQDPLAVDKNSITIGAGFRF